MSQGTIGRLDKIITGNGLEIAKGNVSGHSGVNKFGENADIDTGTPEDLWNQGGTYTFSATANIDSMSSSNGGDTQDVTIEGLDVNFALVIQTIKLTGQTLKPLDTDLIRVFRAYNANGTNFTGDIYIYITGASVVAGVPQLATDIRAKMDAGDNQTLMAVYTVPAGKTGYLFNYHVSMAKLTPATALVCSMRVRKFGEVFRVRDRGATATTGATSYTRELKTPIELLEKTDVKIVIDSVTSNDTAVAGGFDIILVDNSN